MNSNVAGVGSRIRGQAVKLAFAPLRVYKQGNSVTWTYE